MGRCSALGAGLARATTPRVTLLREGLPPHPVAGKNGLDPSAAACPVRAFGVWFVGVLIRFFVQIFPGNVHFRHFG
jgi:hypothetical protein